MYCLLLLYHTTKNLSKLPGKLDSLLIREDNTSLPELAVEGGTDFFYIIITHKLKDEQPGKEPCNPRPEALHKDTPEGIEIEVQPEHFKKLIRNQSCNKRCK